MASIGDTAAFPVGCRKYAALPRSLLAAWAAQATSSRHFSYIFSEKEKLSSFFQQDEVVSLARSSTKAKPSIQRHDDRAPNKGFDIIAHGRTKPQSTHVLGTDIWRFSYALSI